MTEPAPVVPASPSYIHVDFIGLQCHCQIHEVSNDRLLSTAVHLAAQLSRSCSAQTGGLLSQEAAAATVLEHIKARLPLELAALAQRQQLLQAPLPPSKP